MRVLSFFVAALLATQALAVQPDEVLDDPALEARARALSAELRCLVCRNESIDESNAELARDLRLLLRERLVAGDTDEDAVQYLVDRYGEYVLLRPRLTAQNAVLWFGGAGFLIAGAAAAALYLRRRARPQARGPALTEAERQRLSELLDE